jgi:DNA-binding beta-propeller fold protein YncE
MRLQRPITLALRVGVAGWLGVAGLGVAQATPTAIPNKGPGMISTLMGVGRYNGDNQPATSAALSMPQGQGITGIALFEPAGVAMDQSGNLYISDTQNNRIRKVDSTGMITTVAGTGSAGFSGDGGPGTKAQVNAPRGVQVAPDGSLYIADYGNKRVRRLGTDGVITTVAGNGQSGNGGNGGPATKASIRGPSQVVFSRNGSGAWYIVDRDSAQVRKVDASGGISVLAGQGVSGFSGDGAPAANAKLSQPTDLAATPDGSVFIADSDNQRIRRVDPSGNIWTVVNTAGTRYSGTNGSAEFDPAAAIGSNMTGLATAMTTDRPKGIVYNPVDDSLYVSDQSSNRVFRLMMPAAARAMIASVQTNVDLSALPTPMDASGGFPVLRWYNVAGNMLRGYQSDIQAFDVGGSPQGDFGDGGPSRQALLRNPEAITVGPDGSVYVLDQGNLRVRKISNPSGVTPGPIDRVAGAYGGNSGAPSVIQVLQPRGVTVAKDGTVYVADTDRNVIRRISPDGSFSDVVAGNGTKGDTPAVVNPQSQQTILTGQLPVATLSRINYPTQVTVGPDGNVYWADRGSHRIKRVNFAMNPPVLEVVAGTGVAGFESASGGNTEGNLAQNERLNYPGGIAFGPDGNLYVADLNNSRIRKITNPTDPPNALMYTVAGDGSFSYSGDGGSAVGAEFANPVDVSVGPDGSIYIADSGNACIRKIDPKGIINPFAGTCGTAGFGGDGGPATDALLNDPRGVNALPDGRVAIADSANNRIRLVDTDGKISTVAGTGSAGENGDGGAAKSAQLRYPRDVAYDPTSNSLVVADTDNNRIRVIGL